MQLSTSVERFWSISDHCSFAFPLRRLLRPRQFCFLSSPWAIVISVVFILVAWHVLHWLLQTKFKPYLVMSSLNPFSVFLTAFSFIFILTFLFSFSFISFASFSFYSCFCCCFFFQIKYCLLFFHPVHLIHCVLLLPLLWLPVLLEPLSVPHHTCSLHPWLYVVHLRICLTNVLSIVSSVLFI